MQRDIIDLFVSFSFNYPIGFITEAFKDNPHMGKHFQEKFSGYYNRFGNGETALLWLYSSMTDHHRQTLLDYIEKHYKG